MTILGINLDGIWWWLCKSLMQIVHWIGQAFNFLVGAEMTDASGNGGTGSNISNLFVTIFEGGEGRISMTTLYFAILTGCLLLMGAFVAIGAIKSQFTKGTTDSLTQMGEKTFYAILKMLFIPVVFLVALQAVGYIFNWLIAAMSIGVESRSIAQMLCDACTTVSPGFDFDQSFDPNMSDGGFNFVMCILASCFLVVTLVTVSINLVKRIIEVFFYYLTAPVALARTPLDDGKSFDLWKENVISKLLSAGGIIICMYLYYRITPLFLEQVEAWKDLAAVGEDRTIIANVLSILFIIGGSAVPANASMMLAQLISQGAGQNESSNLMHTQQMLNSGLNLAGKAAFAGMGAAGAAIFGKNRGAGAGASTRLRDGNGGGSDTNSPMRTGYEDRGGAGGGSDALTNGGGNGGGTTPPTPAGGGAARTGYFSKVGGEVKNAFQSAGRAWNNPSQIQGFFGKVGAGIAAAGALAAGIALAPVKPLIKKGASVAGHGISKGASKVGGAVGGAAKKGWTAIRGGEAGAIKRKNNQTVDVRAKQIKQKAKNINAAKKANAEADIDTSTLRGSLEVDRRGALGEGFEQYNTTGFVNRKSASLSEKMKKTEDYLSNDKKAKKWSDEQKSAYRQARYGREASEYMGFRNQIQGNVGDKTMSRYNQIFKDLQSKLPTDFNGGNNAGKGGDA